MSDPWQGVLAHWEDPSVESMYDKFLLAQEIRLISRYIPQGSRVLDAGCGEAEGSLAYSQTPGVEIVAADYSDTRLAMARARLGRVENVELRKVDFVQEAAPFGPIFDVVISQRFLINLSSWKLQRRALAGLTGCLGPGGLLLVLEGSNEGVRELNALRDFFRLPPIPIKWHNVFFDDEALCAFMQASGCELVATEGLGAYFLLTRGIRPFFERGELRWDADFNACAATPEVETCLSLRDRFSRLKLWVFRKLSQPSSMP